MNSSAETGGGLGGEEPAYILLPMTVLYSLIFVTGLVGNLSTCVVIARNRGMHTTTNYYLFSLAVSDLLLLISGLPPEVYVLWVKSYVFGENFCILTGFTGETCANATVLTITAFTVERYVAICHPFYTQKVSKLSRAIRYIILIWVIASLLALPQAIQFGVLKEVNRVSGNQTAETLHCTLKYAGRWLKYSFQISTLLFFVLPMTLITALYLFIGVSLHRSRLIKHRPHMEHLRAQKHIVRMLVAVVVGFFLCWAPFHAQRLLAVYATQGEKSSLVSLYKALTHVSGVFYYLSTTINPLLYNIMSNKFRKAFKDSLAEVCGGRKKLPVRSYSVLSRANTQPSLALRNGGGQFAARRPQTRQPLPATISNSSLQDAGVQEEYSGAELASYMGQLNDSAR